MNINFLEWDSNFFEKKIGYIDLSNDSWKDVNGIFKIGKDESFDLVYGFLKVKDKQTKIPDLVKRYYQTTNVVYQKKTSNETILVDDNIRKADAEKDNVALKELAFQAGHSSRFFKDLKFGFDSGERLYHAWIENSLNKSFANEVKVYAHEEVFGLITLKSKDNDSEIGLIAVDSKHRNQNIGTKLLASAEKYAQENKSNFIKVGTQIENANACRFYEKNHFTPESFTQIYHFWL